MNRPIPLMLPFVCLFACLFLATAPAVSEDQRVAVPLTWPDRPVQLEVDLFAGAIEVTGYDGREVVVVASSQSREYETDQSGGMRRIPNTSLGLTIEEHENRVSVEGGFTNRTISLRIQVPFRTSAEISSVNQGNIVVRGLTGDLELQNTNGAIEATGISGSVVAATTNGAVRVTLVDVSADKAMSFATLNGNVDVSFPANIRAELRIEPGRGEILTDFDVQIQPTTPEVRRGDSGRGYRVDLQNDVRATIGGGGPVYSFETMNGGIFIRKTKI